MNMKESPMPPVPSNEAARLRALRQYNILDTGSEKEFDELARLAKQICKAPVALISFVERERVWFKARLGVELKQTLRNESFCAQAIFQSELFIVSDASTDERFKNNPFVAAGPFIKFYAGAPLVTSEGYALGTLCVLDQRSRSLSQEQKEALQSLARQVVAQLELRSSLANLKKLVSQVEVETLGRQRAEGANRDREARFKCILNSNLTGVAFATISGLITEANDTFLNMFGFTREDLLLGELRWPAITPAEHRLLEDKALKEMKTEDFAPVEKEYLHKDGSRIPVLFRAAPLEGSDQEFVCFLLDLTSQKQAQMRVNHLAYYDALTDLPNQVLFKDRLHQALALTRRTEQILAVMLIDLDRFKVINDTLGYQAGDKVLEEVAGRLSNCVRESDTVARFGSDEFAVLLTQINRPEDAAITAQNIKAALDMPYLLGEQELFITSRMGISIHPHDGKDTPTLLRSAATALNRAKEQNSNNYEFYTPGRTTMALRQLVLENNLRPALDREEFVIHYQPQVNIETAQVVGMEALIRWEHPGLGLLYPTEFIGLAEDNGLIVLLGEWVLNTACLQSKAWQDAGFEPLRLAVNLSARQFQQSKLVESVAKVLEDTGLEPHCLELELTEGSIMKNPEHVIGKLHEFREMGVKISIDDFGTGYSSLSYLKRFPIDTLKIDQSFVRDVSTDPDDAAIVKAIITLAHALKLNVIAEGVETAEQLEFLRMLKCDEVQGFLFSKALTTEEFTQLLKERRRHSSPRDYTTSRLHPLSDSLRRAG